MGFRQFMLDILYDALAHYVVLEVPDRGFFLGLTFALHLGLKEWGQWTLKCACQSKQWSFG